MENKYINGNNNDYDIILPFELYYNCTISGKNISIKDDESKSGEDDKSDNKSSFHNISLFEYPFLLKLLI